MAFSVKTKTNKQTKKNCLPANAGDIQDAGSIPGSGRSPGEGNGNPLQCSCLENPRDGEFWWAAVYGIAQSWTRLKRLSSSSYSLLHGIFLTQGLNLGLLHCGFPSGSDGKASACNAGDLGCIPGLGKSPGEGNGKPLQYSCPRNPMNRGAGRLQPMGSQRVRHD